VCSRAARLRAQRRASAGTGTPGQPGPAAVRRAAAAAAPPTLSRVRSRSGGAGRRGQMHKQRRSVPQASPGCPHDVPRGRVRAARAVPKAGLMARPDATRWTTKICMPCQGVGFGRRSCTASISDSTSAASGGARAARRSSSSCCSDVAPTTAPETSGRPRTNLRAVARGEGGTG
jgi:hypothetical protein